MKDSRALDAQSVLRIAIVRTSERNPTTPAEAVDEGDGWMNYIFPRVDDKGVDGNTYIGRGRTCYV